MIKAKSSNLTYWAFILWGIEYLFENLMKAVDLEPQKNGNTKKERKPILPANSSPIQAAT